MPRILHLIDTGGPGGAETVLANLAGGLPRSRWTSRVLVPREDWLSGRLGQEGIEVHVCASRGSGDLGLLARLVKEIRAFRPHLIHAHFLGSGVYGTLASTFSGHAPLVCTFHGIPDVDPDDRLLPLKARILARSKNRTVYVSHHLRRHLEPILGLPAHLGRTIHNGVPFSDPRGEGDAGLRRELGFGPEDRIVGAVGNIRLPKDYFNLLRAARLVLTRARGVKFVVVGEGSGPLLEDLLSERDELGLAGVVHFLGFRQDVPSLMAAFEIFVSSSSDEGLPLASVEAMGMGRPVVLTACGGVPEVVEQEVNGLLVPPRDPSALARGILALLDDPPLAARLGSEALSSVRQRFSLGAMLEAYQRLYLDLIPRPGAPHA